MLSDEDLNEFTDTTLFAITIAIGATTLLFSNGGTVLIQCPFERRFAGRVVVGHGENINTSVSLFDCLGKTIKEVKFLSEGVLKFCLSEDNLISIISEKNGTESYVVTTKNGISPIF